MENMAKKMLIDATHPEETRIVVVEGNKVEEFDFESKNRRQLAGNIYLAKVTRIEPSLQAAFIDYGGNRHGFLAFSEIHPDYYQIPIADREALIAEEQAYSEAMRKKDEDEGSDENLESLHFKGEDKYSRTEKSKTLENKSADKSEVKISESSKNVKKSPKKNSKLARETDKPSEKTKIDKENLDNKEVDSSEAKSVKSPRGRPKK